MKKIILLSTIILFAGLAHCQSPFYFSVDPENHFPHSVIETHDEYIFSMNQIYTENSSSAFIYYFSKSGKLNRIDTFRSSQYNLFYEFNYYKDSIYIFLIHFDIPGQSYPILSMYKVSNGKNLRLVDTFNLPDIYTSGSWHLKRLSDSIIYLGIYSIPSKFSIFYKINLRTKKIQSNSYPAIQHASFDLSYTFDLDSFIIKGLGGIQLINIKNLNTSGLEYGGIIYGEFSGQFDRWEEKQLYLNTGSQLTDKNLADHLDSFDFGVTLFTKNFSVYKNLTFGKTNDTIEIPAFVNSVQYGKDYLLFGGTSNFQWDWPYGYEDSWFTIAKADTSFQLQWLKYYGGDAYYVMIGIYETSDKSILAYGFRYDWRDASSDLDIYIIKVNQKGEVVFTKNIPSNSKPVYTFPNPANYKITMGPIKDCANCTIVVSNVVGQKVIIKENVDFSISFELDIMDLSAGTYFYNIDYKSTSIAKGKFVKQ